MVPFCRRLPHSISLLEGLPVRGRGHVILQTPGCRLLGRRKGEAVQRYCKARLPARLAPFSYAGCLGRVGAPVGVLRFRNRKFADSFLEGRVTSELVSENRARKARFLGCRREN